MTNVPSDALSKRFRPLYVATFFHGLALWVPIEKLFMTSIGFTAASIGVMAAVYARDCAGAGGAFGNSGG